MLPELTKEKGIDLRQLLSDVQDMYLKQALDLTSGNKARAAKLLGMERTTFALMLERKFTKEVIKDPEGDFTAAKEGSSWVIRYKGEVMAHKRNIAEVNGYLKGKMK